MLEAITRLSKLTCSAIAIVLQLLADMPGSITLWEGLQLVFSHWNEESGGELKAWEGIDSCKNCKPTWDTLVSLSGSYVKSENTRFLQLIKQLQEQRLILKTKENPWWSCAEEISFLGPQNFCSMMAVDQGGQEMPSVQWEHWVREAICSVFSSHSSQVLSPVDPIWLLISYPSK